MSDLLKKLQDLGLKIDRASNLETTRNTTTNVNDFVDGEWLESNGSRIFLVKRLYPYGSDHGIINLDRKAIQIRINEFWQIGGSEDLDIRKIVFLDTETSSFSIGAGALIFLFGCCYFVDEGLEVLQMLIEDPSHEFLFLNEIGNHLEKFKCLASYNGKSFDIPVLRSRYILNRSNP